LVDDAGASDAAGDDSLAAALLRHGIELPADQVKRLDKYCRLLWQWNEKLNLTRHTDFEKFVTRDLADSQQLARLLRPGEEVLDVGTGGGVPGVVLAVLRPDLRVSLCDSVGKKVAAVRQILEAIGLDVPVYQLRAEEILEEMRFDALVVRAVGPLDKLLVWFKRHWESMRRLLVIKGPRWREELAEAKRRGLVRELQVKPAAEYPLAGTQSQSVILKIWPVHRPER
jgi:16S rRNA (guanine527-N7)-methyltransferase